MSVILHIAERVRWERAVETGVYTVASLETEGFIHCSTPKQVVRVANALFGGQRDLVLLCIDESKLAATVKYEPPSPGLREPLFPHVYGPIEAAAVTDVLDFEPDARGRFELPEQLRHLAV